MTSKYSAGLLERSAGFRGDEQCQVKETQTNQQWRVELITGRPDVEPVYGGERATKGRAPSEGLRGASAYRYT